MGEVSAVSVCVNSGHSGELTGGRCPNVDDPISCRVVLRYRSRCVVGVLGGLCV